MILHYLSHPGSLGRHRSYANSTLGPPLLQCPLLTSTQGCSSVDKVYSHMLSLLWDKEVSDAHFAAEETKASKRKWATLDMSTFKLSPVSLQAAAASTCYRQHKILISELNDHLSQFFFFSSFSREFDWDVGIVPVPGDRDAQADSFPHCWEWFWYIRPVSHTLNVTVLQGSRKEHGVLGVKTPGLPHSSLSLFLPMQLNPSCQDPEGSFSLPLQDSAARPVYGVDCQIH